MRVRSLAIALTSLILTAGSVPAQTAPRPSIRLQIPGSGIFGTEQEVPLRTALLMVDTTSVSAGRAQKGLTVAYLILSTADMGCETSGAFDRTSFLQQNLVPLPRLPHITDPRDVIFWVTFLDSFDPKKASTSALVDALSATREGKALAGGGAIHLHSGDVQLVTGERPEKAYSTFQPPFRASSNAFEQADGGWQWHFDVKALKTPLTPGMVILRRGDDGLAAEIRLESKAFRVSGTVPVMECERVARTITE